MATRTTKTITPADEATRALEQRRKAREKRTAHVDVTIEQRAVAAMLRERDHREACPAYEAPDGAARVEAYADRTVAPGPDLQALGVGQGDIVIVVRCLECGQLRYLAGYEQHRTPQAALESFVDDQLTALADQTVLDTDAGDLDTNLE